MKRGEASRHVGSTGMNERSSRSHTLFRMVIESVPKSDASPLGVTESENSKKGKKSKSRAASQLSGGGSVRVSLLTLVDLAGSERVQHTQAGGTRLREGAHINTSLLHLSRVIHMLSEGQGEFHTHTRSHPHPLSHTHTTYIIYVHF